MSNDSFSFDNNRIVIHNCDMFDKNSGLYSLEKGQIDAVITDFPYGTLNKRNTWDKVINFDEFWKEFHRFGKPTTPLITTAQMPFTAYLISTNYNEFKYTWVWEKSKATAWLNAKKQPLMSHEDIVVFYNKQCTYNPQMVQGKPYDRGIVADDAKQYGSCGKVRHIVSDDGYRYPRSVLYFVTAESEGKLHPTQKPISLMEYLIKTYTNEDDLVLDPCFGSGTTAIACINTNRRFVGFEMDGNFFNIAKSRIEERLRQDVLWR